MTMLWSANHSLNFKSTCNFKSWIISTFLCINICTKLPGTCTVMAQSVDRHIGTVYGYIGESTTLHCDLRNIFHIYPIVWDRIDPQLYISYDETLYGDVPDDFRNRYSVVCDRIFDKCSLTINPTTLNDNGTYECGYSDGNYFYPLSTGYLIVTYGELPSDDSPICDIFERAADGRSIPKLDTSNVGDKIFLGCQAKGSPTLRPSLLWKLNDRNGSFSTITPPSQGLSLQHEVKLTNEDIGVEFTCVMTHPALNEPRNCSVTPLPRLLTPAIPTASLSSTSSFIAPLTSEFHLSSVAITPEKPITNIQAVTKDSKEQQSYVVPVVASVITILVVTGFIVLGFVILKRTNRKGVIPAKPDYELTFDRDRSITADYAAINVPDSIDKALELKADTKTDQISPNNNITEEEDAFPVYAKPDKTKKLTVCIDESAASDHYENIPNPSGASLQGEDGLMYADLDLLVNSSSPRMPINIDASVYADIKGTL